MPLLAEPVKRTRKEWAIYRQEHREQELYWRQLDEAEARGDLDEFIERDDELYDEDWNLREPYATIIAELEIEAKEGGVM